MTTQLQQFADIPIDWDLTPEHAVTMYLEWGNNDWNSQYGLVRSKSDVSTYFVVDTWQEEPIIRLVRRNSEQAVDLVSFPMPKHLVPGFKAENGNLKGISAPEGPVKDWLKEAMGQQ